MIYVISYDIDDDKRRNKISKVLEEYGVRVLESVFECRRTVIPLFKLFLKGAVCFILSFGQILRVKRTYPLQSLLDFYIFKLLYRRLSLILCSLQ